MKPSCGFHKERIKMSVPEMGPWKTCRFHSRLQTAKNVGFDFNTRLVLLSFPCEQLHETSILVVEIVYFSTIKNNSLILLVIK